MKKTFLTFLIVSGLSIGALCQQMVFEKTYPPPASTYCHDRNTGNYGNDIALCPDNSILILATCMVGGDTCTISGAGIVAIRLLKLNPAGDTLWTKIYLPPLLIPEDPNFLMGTAIARTSDNNFIISGEIEPGPISLVDGFLMKVDPDGELLWRHEYSAGFITHFSTVIETSDHGFLAGGYKASAFGSEQMHILLKTDSLGNEEWHQIYGGGYFGDCHSISDNADGTFTVMGSVIRPEPFVTKFKFLIQLINGADGNEISRQLLGDTTRSQHCYRGIATSDGNYLMAGDEKSPRKVSMCAIKADKAGNIIWYKIYGDSLLSYRPRAVHETCDSGFMITGGVVLCHVDHSNQVICDTTKSFVTKLDKEGNLEWENIWGFPNDWSDMFLAVAEYYDHSFITTGFADSEIYTIRFDSSAFCDPVNVHYPSSGPTNEVAKIYPNPAGTAATIEILENLHSAGLEFVLSDLYGKIHKRLKLNDSPNKLERAGLTDGMYFYSILKENKIIQTGKLVFSGN